MSGPGYDTPPPTADPADLVSAAFADAVACADHVAASTTKAFAGSYAPADAAADVIACTATAAAWAGRLAETGWMLTKSLLVPPPIAAQPSARVQCQATYAPRPLTLHTVGCRAIGYGADYFIHGNQITFEPPVLDSPPDTRFVMVVDWHGLPLPATTMTIVYEGEVTSVQNGNIQVCDPIRFVKPAFAA